MNGEEAEGGAELVVNDSNILSAGGERRTEV